MTLPEDYFPVSLGLHKQPQTFPSGGTQFLSASFCSVSTSMAADTWFFHGSKLRSTLPSSPANAHRCVEIHRILRSFPRAHPSFHRIDILNRLFLFFLLNGKDGHKKLPVFLSERGRKGVGSQAANADYACGLCFCAQNLEDALFFVSTPAIISIYLFHYVVLVGTECRFCDYDTSPSRSISRWCSVPEATR